MSEPINWPDGTPDHVKLPVPPVLDPPEGMTRCTCGVVVIDGAQHTCAG
ncbi:hypothetical protein [Streptomyces sp. SBT349]|nr:hypothetical protein [Streptomyces sp. SBT349]